MKLDQIENEDKRTVKKQVKKSSGNRGGVSGIKMDKDTIFFIEAGIGIILLIVLIIIALMLLFKKQPETPDYSETTIESFVSKEDGKTEEIDLNDDVYTTELEEAGESEALEANDDTNSAIDENKILDLTKNNKKKTVKGELPQNYSIGKMLTYTVDDYQLPEIYAYWDNYQMDAVADLIRLERVREITDSLKGSNDFYYYGETNSKGQPEGKGLAVYAYNTYYFGSWVNGVRSGSGMWLRIFIDNPGIVNGVKGVTEHQYVGEWSGDYPNGEGQEHFDYDEMKTDNEYVLTNVIGQFKNGYYHGDMYLIRIASNGAQTDWYGTAQMGSFKVIESDKDSKGKVPIWKLGEGFDSYEYKGYRWILPEENVDFGIAGLKR